MNASAIPRLARRAAALALVLAVGRLCAQTTGTLGSLNYSDSGTAVTITASPAATGVITIPSTINGHPVTTIASYAFYGTSGLTGVSIPSSVTSLGQFAFFDCTDLVAVSLSPGLATIQSYCFADCTGLSSITFPASVTSIGPDAFGYCYSLSNVTFLGNAPSAASAFQGDTNAAITYFDGTTGWTNPFAALPAFKSPFTVTISGGSATITAYADTGAGGAVSIPPTISGVPVTAIATNAFAGSDVTSVTIPASVTTLGAGAFANCAGLTSVTFWGNRPASTDPTAFQGDTAVVTYYAGTTGWTSTLAGLSTAVSPFQFTDTAGAVTITGYTGPGGPVVIPGTLAGDTVVAINANAFSGKSLTAVSIPPGVATIGSGAFASNSGLLSVTFLGNAPTAASTAFQGDGSASITYNPNTTGWSSPFAGLTASPNVFVYAVSGSSATITGYNGAGGSVTIPAAIAGYPVTAIGGNAFGSVTSTLTSVVIPSGVTTIGDSAFSGCTALTSVTIPSTVTTIGSEAFFGCSVLSSVSLPSGLTTLGTSAFYGCPALASVTIPQGITALGDQVFYQCTSLTSVTIPSGVTTIGTGTFFGCTGITSVSLPGSLVTIGSQAFQGCTGLASVTIPGSVATIAAGAFAQCVNLTAVSCLGNAPSTDSGAFQGDTKAALTYPSGKTGWTNPFAGLPATAITSVAYLSNLSARAYVGTGAGILFAGFSTAGSGSKQLLLRAVGPGMLSTFGLTGNLTDAQLQLFDNTSTLITTNHGWGSAPVRGPSTVSATAVNATPAEMASLGAFSLVTGSLDSALLVTVPNLSFTYEVAGTGATPPTGVGLAEIYDADGGNPPATLTNISARAQVGTGVNILIAGFTIAGNATERVLIRGVGPGLNHTFGLTGILATPQLQLFDSAGRIIATNVGWNNAPTLGTSPVLAVVTTASANDMSTVGAFGLVSGSADCAMDATLPAGGYTAQLTGVGGTSGIGLVEVYQLP
jgi:BspA type Leucine rich repeat region (6 copies)